VSQELSVLYFSYYRKHITDVFILVTMTTGRSERSGVKVIRERANRLGMTGVSSVQALTSSKCPNVSAVPNFH
jgi:hypothetical protein